MRQAITDEYWSTSVPVANAQAQQPLAISGGDFRPSWPT
jgi:hypothetical protein